VSDLGRPAVRLSTAELTENLGQLAADLIESAVQLDVQSVDFLIDTLNQLVERVDVGTLLAHLTLDLGLGHCGNHSGGGGLRSRYASLAPQRVNVPLRIRKALFEAEGSSPEQRDYVARVGAHAGPLIPVEHTQARDIVTQDL
jgi:hypothetical protein